MKVLKNTASLKAVELPVSDFKLRWVDTPKRSALDARSGCNAGFFGVFREGGESFTLPAGHTVADVDTKSRWAKHYAVQDGALDGDKLRWSADLHTEQFRGREVSTLVIGGGKAGIYRCTLVSAADYAVSGVPVLRNGMAQTWANALAEGWDGSCVYATWHILLGLRDAETIVVAAYKSRGKNLIASGEAAQVMRGLGCPDAIKLDGGGSAMLCCGGATLVNTAENRRVATVIDFGTGDPWPVPTRALKRGAVGDDVRWMQYELNREGNALAVDGSFGPACLKALRQFQSAAGLEVDGSCGPLTRAALLEVPYSSRKLDDLRCDVAEQCRAFLARCRAAGYDVLVTQTVRNGAEQRRLAREGYASKSATVPTFHAQGVGLAFDVCKNVKGHEYDDAAFFAAVGKIGEEMGFTWGGRWKSFPDRPHFQWDDHGKITSSMIRAGKRPPVME